MYALHSRKWKTASGESGQLLVCLFFPASRRLSNGKSPLSLLDSIVDVFSILHASDERIPSGEQDPSPFRSLLQRYELEDRPTSLPVMQGYEPASYCVETVSQLDALMRHSRYDSLALIGRLELGFHCSSMIKLAMGVAPKPKPAPKPEPKPEPKLEPAPEPEPEPKSESESKPELKPEPALVPEPKPMAKPEPQQGPVKPRRRTYALNMFGSLLLAIAGVTLFFSMFSGDAENEPSVTDQDRIDSLKYQSAGENMSNKEEDGVSELSDSAELMAEEQEKLAQEEEAAKKAEEEAKAKAEAEAKLRAESRKACLAFLTSTIGNEDSLKGAYQAVQQMQEYKALPEEDKKTVKTVFDCAQYKDVNGYNLSGDVKEMVKEAGLDNWGSLVLLSYKIKNYIADFKQ